MNNIRRKNLPCEKHTVQTQDGYILTLHRIPPPKPKQNNQKIILLMHGMFWEWIAKSNMIVISSIGISFLQVFGWVTNIYFNIRDTVEWKRNSDVKKWCDQYIMFYIVAKSSVVFNLRSFGQCTSVDWTNCSEINSIPIKWIRLRRLAN